jgi:hypothetical protein
MRKLKKVLAIFLTVVGSQAARADLKGLKELFHQGKVAELREGTEYWSGRCFTTAKPDYEQSGLIVLYRNPVNQKIHLPAFVLDQPADLWDDLDDVEKDRIDAFNMIHNNDFAKVKSGALFSYLAYEYGPMAIMQLRQTGSEYILKVTNLEPENGGDLAEKFYCRFFKKVM